MRATEQLHGQFLTQNIMRIWLLKMQQKTESDILLQFVWCCNTDVMQSQVYTGVYTANHNQGLQLSVIRNRIPKVSV